MEMGLEVRNAKNSRLRGLDEVIPGRGPAPCRSLGGTAWSEQPRSVQAGGGGVTAPERGRGTEGKRASWENWGGAGTTWAWEGRSKGD